MRTKNKTIIYYFEYSLVKSVFEVFENTRLKIFRIQNIYLNTSIQNLYSNTSTGLFHDYLCIKCIIFAWRVLR